MKRSDTIRFVTWVMLVLATALLFTGAAQAKGGAVIHNYAPPPLDAGSAVPNPDYLPKVTASDSGNGFDWGDAGIGGATGFTVVVLLATGSAIVLRRRGSAAT